MGFRNIFRFRRNASPQRKGLHLAVYEGISSVILSHILSGPFLTAYLLYLGATTQQIGIVLAIPALANVLQIVGAVFMQKFVNRKASYIIFGTFQRIIGISTGLIPFLFPQDLWVAIYIILFALSAINNSLLAVIWTSLISDMVPKQIRGQYFGFRNIILGAIGSLFLFVVGLILENYPGETGFEIMYIVGLVSIVINIFLFTLYPNPKFEKSEESKMGLLLLKPFRDKLFFRAMMFLSIWILLVSSAHPFFSYVMLDVLGISYQYVSIITIIQSVSSMVGFYVWGNLTRNFSSRTLLLWTLPFVALSILLWGSMAFIPTLVVLVIISLLQGFGLGGFSQLVFIFVIGDTPKAERPVFIAVFSAITGMAGFIGPMIGGFIFDRLKHSHEWIQSYGVFTVTGIILLVLALVVGPIVFKAQPSQVEQ